MSQTSAYPPGTWEGDPTAPWNQNPYKIIEVRQAERCLEAAQILQKELKIFKNSEDESVFDQGWELAASLGNVAEIIEGLESLLEEN